MDVEAEIRELKRRVGELEGSFGFLTQQIKGVHKDLLAFQARTEERFGVIEGRLDRMDGRLDRMDSRFDRIDTEIRGLRTDMPRIVGEVMRDVLRERDAKSR
jgi:hypothetical protein